MKVLEKQIIELNLKNLEILKKWKKHIRILKILYKGKKDKKVLYKKLKKNASKRFKTIELKEIGLNLKDYNISKFDFFYGIRDEFYFTKKCDANIDFCVKELNSKWDISFLQEKYHTNFLK